jgi:hypothetical protein
MPILHQEIAQLSLLPITSQKELNYSDQNNSPEKYVIEVSDSNITVNFSPQMKAKKYNKSQMLPKNIFTG